MTLLPKHERFVQEYLLDLNATKAARRAGYSPGSARSQGQRLLTYADIQAAIREALERREVRAEVRADRVLKELARLAHADIRQVVEWGPTGVRLKPSAELDEKTAAAICEVFQGRDGRLRVKLHPKLPALEMLARHLGLFEADNRPDPQEVAFRLREAFQQMQQSLDMPSPYVNDSDHASEIDCGPVE